MQHADFKLGATFWTGAGKWRVTDIGARTIIAIRLTQNWEPIAEGWLKGPPYAVAEHVFSENDFAGCAATEADFKKDHGG